MYMNAPLEIDYDVYLVSGFENVAEVAKVALLIVKASAKDNMFSPLCATPQPEGVAAA